MIKRKLLKTILSQKISLSSWIMGLSALTVLFIGFHQFNQEWRANGHLVFNQGQWWKAFTTTLVHGDLNHLFSNTLYFTGLAALLHSYFGWRIFPILSFLAGGMINLIVLKIYPKDVYLVGASGVVYFMAAFWMTIYVLTERKLTLVRRFINAIAISLILLFPQVIRPEVSYLAHSVGFALGVPLAISWFLANKNKIRSKEEWIETEEPEIEVSEEDFKSRPANIFLKRDPTTGKIRWFVE
jgi:rhomboid protease GluP